MVGLDPFPNTLPSRDQTSFPKPLLAGAAGADNRAQTLDPAAVSPAIGPRPPRIPFFFPRSIGPFLRSVSKPTILAMGKLVLTVSVCPVVAAPLYSAKSGFLFLVGLGAPHSCQYSVVVVVLDFVQLPA